MEMSVETALASIRETIQRLEDEIATISMDIPGIGAYDGYVVVLRMVRDGVKSDHVSALRKLETGYNFSATMPSEAMYFATVPWAERQSQFLNSDARKQGKNDVDYSVWSLRRFALAALANKQSALAGLQEIIATHMQKGM